MAKKSGEGTRPADDGTIQIVPPVIIMRTLDSLGVSTDLVPQELMEKVGSWMGVYSLGFQNLASQ